MAATQDAMPQCIQPSTFEDLTDIPKLLVGASAQMHLCFCLLRPSLTSLSGAREDVLQTVHINSEP